MKAPQTKLQWQRAGGRRGCISGGTARRQKGQQTNGAGGGLIAMSAPEVDVLAVDRLDAVRLGRDEVARRDVHLQGQGRRARNMRSRL